MDKKKTLPGDNKFSNCFYTRRVLVVFLLLLLCVK